MFTKRFKGPYHFLLEYFTLQDIDSSYHWFSLSRLVIVSGIDLSQKMALRSMTDYFQGQSNTNPALISYCVLLPNQCLILRTKRKKKQQKNSGPKKPTGMNS